ncbi:mfs phosphate transporter [Lasallia pustulata]|uniref:Mfs phosphate transporter n=1 Tax=Lasallia pustulata TaxID=136370 RepID=A0A1W5CTN6_9LECA|nr:mfs phosphate transporter [Lasallia pustulata]
MRSASRQLAVAKKKCKVTGYDTQSLKLTFGYFGPRLIATAGAWFANDIFFYGNKLFQSNFIAIITHKGTSIMPGWLYNLINVGVSLCGYYLASFFIDNKLYGRKKMQTVGFLMDFILFVIPAFNYNYFTSPEHIKGFQAMYFLSSFFNQFGPNAVTFLVAAEVYPTPIRATAHGFSAARFYVVPWFGLAGVVLTVLFLPDTTDLDLKEQECRWQFIRAGPEQDYHGIAVHPKHLSLWERFRGVGKHYNADLDYKQKIEDMRADWEISQARHVAEKEGHMRDDDDVDDSVWSSDVSTYFERTGGTPSMLPKEKYPPWDESESPER